MNEPGCNCSQSLTLFYQLEFPASKIRYSAPATGKFKRKNTGHVINEQSSIPPGDTAPINL